MRRIVFDCFHIWVANSGSNTSRSTERTNLASRRFDEGAPIP